MLPLVFFFPVPPRPRDGALDFSVEPASLAVVATNRVLGNSSAASSLDTAVKESAAAARDFFPAPRSQDGTLDFRIAPASPAAVATHGDSAQNSRADANCNTALRGDDALNRPSSTRDVPKPTPLAVSIRTNPDDRSSIATPSGVDARSPSARSARRMVRHALITANQVAAAQATAITSAASPRL